MGKLTRCFSEKMNEQVPIENRGEAASSQERESQVSFRAPKAELRKWQLQGSKKVNGLDQFQGWKR